VFAGQAAPVRRKYREFEVISEVELDVVARGIISIEDAVLYFDAFFNGCVGRS
jgi:hypothetical protein